MGGRVRAARVKSKLVSGRERRDDEPDCKPDWMWHGDINNSDSDEDDYDEDESDAWSVELEAASDGLDTRFRELAPDALGEQWHVLDVQGLYSEEDRSRTIDRLALASRSRFLTDTDLANDVRRLDVRGVLLGSIGAMFPRVKALVIDPADDFPESPWSFDLTPLSLYGARLHHLELNLCCVADHDDSIARALKALVGLRRLYLWGQKGLSLAQVRVIERMGMLEDVLIEEAQCGGWYDYSEDDCGHPAPVPALDLSRHLRLRSLTLALPEVGLRSVLDRGFEELPAHSARRKRIVDPQKSQSHGATRKHHIGGWLALRPAPNLRHVRISNVIDFELASRSRFILNGYTRRLHDELEALGATIGDNSSCTGPWRKCYAYGRSNYARNAHACAWWASQACERLVGATLPELCIETIRSGCRLALEASELDEEWVAREEEALELHRRK